MNLNSRPVWAASGLLLLLAFCFAGLFWGWQSATTLCGVAALLFAGEAGALLWFYFLKDFKKTKLENREMEKRKKP